MTDDVFIDQSLRKLRTIRALRKVLAREGKGYQSQLHRRCGIGLTVEEFDDIVKRLASTEPAWCSLKEGTNGGVMVVFNEDFANVPTPSQQF
jgi:hypothetical protein